MQILRSSAMVSGAAGCPVSVKTLRQWCAPEVILVVTNLVDEMELMPHVIDQARHSSAKIVLAHVAAPWDGEPLCRKPDRSNSRIREARMILDRMARQFRWLGFACEPLVLSGQPEVEIQSLARSRRADRVIMGFEEPNLAETLLPLMEIPTCVIGRQASFSKRMSTRSITIAISPDSECDVPLGFAFRLAQKLHAKLTLLHVFNRENEEASLQTPEAFAAWLPSAAWREAKLSCPTAICVREGYPAEEILNHCVSTDQDLLILCSPGAMPGHSFRTSTSYRVIAGAQCPVIVLRRQAGLVEPISLSDPEQISAYAEALAGSF
jgi:nucleotide-binding universal stress UspA family protein